MTVLDRCLWAIVVQSDHDSVLMKMSYIFLSELLLGVCENWPLMVRSRNEHSTFSSLFSVMLTLFRNVYLAFVNEIVAVILSDL